MGRELRELRILSLSYRDFCTPRVNKHHTRSPSSLADFTPASQTFSHNIGFTTELFQAPQYYFTVHLYLLPGI